MAENYTDTSTKGYEYFKYLLANMPMIFYVLDQKGIFKLSDGKGLEKLGLKPGQVVGMSAFELYKDFPDIVEALKLALDGQTVAHEHTLGSLVLENHIAPNIDESGHQSGIVGATIDITVKNQIERQLKEANNIMAAIFDSVPGVLYLYDEEGKLVFWNKNHETMTGYNEDELKNMSLADWYKDDPISLQNIVAGLEITSHGGVGYAEADLQCKDGTKIPFYFTAKSVVLDQKNYFVGIGIDLTERKIAENKLNELNETLEKKVIERTQELSNTNLALTTANEELYALNEEIHAMNEELISTNERMREMQSFLVESEKMAALGNMVAGIAHEINTPVGVGVTAASSLMDTAQELLKLKRDNQLTDHLFESYLEDIETTSDIILRNLNRASRLIHSFKQLSVDQSSEPKRKFKVKEYLDEIFISLSPSLKKMNVSIAIQCDEKLEINGYPGAFAQIITNLVMNSIYHGFKPEMSGKITLDFAQKNNAITLVYSDDGLGMNDEVLKKLFNPFYTTKRGTGGSGLGLFVIYGVITKQFNGTIRCESEPNKGATFFITLSQGGN
jgi:PAS domain S-box-containing protein